MSRPSLSPSTVFIDARFDPVYRQSPLVLVDAGARGGLKSNWQAARPHLRVIGFEPDPREFARLAAAHPLPTGAAPPDAPPAPTYFGVALHHRQERIRFHIARDRGLSSIFEPNREFLSAFPDVDRFDIVDTQDVQADALDALLASRGIDDVDFIKADTQGSELFVLQGAARALERSVVGVEVEAEFAPVYRGQPLFADVDAMLRAQGFLLFDLRPVYWKREAGVRAGGPQGEIVWADALYLRSLASLDAVVKAREPRQAGKVLRAMSVALLYGYVDYALEIAHAFARVFSSDERAAIERALHAHVDARRRMPRFPGRRHVAHALRRLWETFREPNDGWSISDADLGNLD